MNFFVFYYMIYLVLNNEEKGYIMKRKIPKITNSEKQILEVLWDEEKPLTSSEIVGVSDDRTWKASSVHLISSVRSREIRAVHYPDYLMHC